MNTKKKKLLVWCDFLVPTGFGNVAKNLLEDMHKYYDVCIVGINYQGNDRYDTSKYFVYPVTREDMLGMRKLPMIVKKENPDLIFLFQDIFHLSEMIKPVREAASVDTKIIAYFPVDGAPFSMAWGNIFSKMFKNVTDGKIGGAEMSGKFGWQELSAVDEVITYSDWAIDVIKDRFPGIEHDVHKLYHGVDPDTFYQLPTPQVKAIRQRLNWTNKFVAINVNRYQPRKLIPFTVRAFSMFAKGYKVCKCGNHMPIDRVKCDLNMCPESDIIEENAKTKDDVYLYLHMMPKEMSMGPGKANLLQNHIINAGFDDGDINRILALNSANIYGGGVPDSFINELYNACNVNITSTLGEGAGLSLIEAASAGTPSIAPKNSAIPEQLRGTGHLIENKSLVNMALDNGHLRPVVDCWGMVQALEVEYKKWQEADEDKVVDQSCLDNIKDNFQWGDKREKLRSIFELALSKEEI